MHLSDEQLQEIFARYLEDNLSPEGLDLLFEHFQTEEGESALNAVLEKAFADPGMVEHGGSGEKKAVLADLLGKIRGSGDDAARTLPGRGKTRRLFSPWMAVAASVIVLVGVGLFFLNRQRRGSVAVEPLPVKSQMAHHGINGAILTLADGSTINLDSANAVAFPAQGNATLSRTTNELRYVADNGNVGEVVYNTVSTPRGRQFSICLSDRTKVWLNAGSSIRFPSNFSTDKREIEVSGEAYLEVAPDKDRPFILQSAGVRVMVLGTRFDVMNYGDEQHAEVMLMQGSVRVGAGAKEVTLMPGLAARIDHVNGSMETRTEDSVKVMAWTRGLLDLNNKDFGALMRQISRWYDVDVVMKSVPKDVHIGGLLHRDVGLEEVLQYLGDNGIHYNLEGRTLTILP